MTIFTTAKVPTFTKEQKKVTRIAKRVHSSRRELMKPSECVVRTFVKTVKE